MCRTLIKFIKYRQGKKIPYSRLENEQKGFNDRKKREITMRKVTLVTCAKNKKHDGCHKARDLYTGNYYKKCMEYADFLGYPAYILSAEHHLLPLDKEISWYDKYLPDMPENEQKDWAETVAADLRNRYDVENTAFIILAGMAYSKYLKTLLPHVEMPLQGHGRNGTQMAYMNGLMGKPSKAEAGKLRMEQKRQHKK